MVKIKALHEINLGLLNNERTETILYPGDTHELEEKQALPLLAVNVAEVVGRAKALNEKVKKVKKEKETGPIIPKDAHRDATKE